MKVHHFPVSQTLKRAEVAFARHARWQALHDEAYEFAMSERGTSRAGEGRIKADRVFDSTAAAGQSRFAGRLLNSLCPPFERWFELEPGLAVPKEKRDAARRALEGPNEAIAAVFQSDQFATAAFESFLDLAVGKGALLVLEGDVDRPVRFVTTPQSEVAIDEGQDGRIEGQFRKFTLAARQILRNWEDAKLTEDLRKLLADKPEEEVSLVEACTYDPKSKRWLYTVIHDCGDKDSARLVERDSGTNPWIIFRWIKNPGEVEGRGPLIQALPDIRTANAVMEMTLMNAALAISGTYTVVDDGVVNPDMIRIQPSGVIPVGSNGGARGPSLLPLPSGHHFDVAQLVLDDLRQVIKKILLDDRLPPDAGGTRSATEIIQRMKELMEDASAAFGRLMGEFVIPIVQRVLDILLNVGTLEQEVKVDDYQVRIKVTSPLARMQDLDDVENLVRYLALAREISPELMAYAVRIEDVLPWLGEKMGVPPSLMREPGERQQLQEQVAGLLAAQQQQQADAASAAGQNQQEVTQ